jgi:peptide/nickel transport system substrate-binding protein
MKCMFAIAALLLAGAGPALAKDDLVIGVAQFPSSLHPDIDAEVVKGYAVDFATRQVTAFDKDWKNSCLLCTEVPTLQNGLAVPEKQPDGSTGLAVTLKLKPELKWADGVPVTAKDVEFTWRVGRDPNSGFSNTNAWNRATKVDIVDDHTVVLHLKQMRVDYNRWDQLLPEHVEGEMFSKITTAGDYLKQTVYNRAPTTPGLWNGPYMITGYQSGVQIVYSPNPYWPGTKPGFKHIIIKHIENTAALQANLLSGDIDMAAGEGIGLTIDQAVALQQQHPDQFTYIFKPSLTYEHIDVKLDSPILSNVAVRQALLYAIDRKTMVSKLFNGLQPVADSFVNPLDPYYSTDVPKYPFDPARARALLAEAGWKPGSDGICRNAAGDRLAIEFSTTSGNRLRELVQQVIQSGWKTACIEGTIKNEPPRTLFGETLKQRKFGGLVMYAWSSGVGDSPRQTLFSGDIPTAANNYGGNNAPGFSNPKMDADIAQAETELDPAKQKAIWADMQTIYATELPALPLYFRAEPHVVPKWLAGYEPTGTSDYSSLWAENWHSR